MGREDEGQHGVDVGLGGFEETVSRRRFLALAGGAGLTAVLAGCTGDGGGEAGTTAAGPGATTTGTGGTPDCVLTPELTEGPYYLDLDLVRRDITEGREGMPFDLSVVVLDADSCEPIENAAVDLWHCDAGGQYSGVEGDSGTFLRGVQMTDADGAATFRTVFPGWYSGRAVHIHVKVNLSGAETFTGQLFFDGETLDAVYATAPYTARGAADVPNDADGIFGQSEGATIVAVEVADGASRGAVMLGVRRV